MPHDDERYEQVTIHVENVVKTTDKAALCEVNGEEHWIPWSQIDPGSEIESEGDSGLAYIPRWLADEKGIEVDD